jgi:hypothetical protein
MDAIKINPMLFRSVDGSKYCASIRLFNETITAKSDSSYENAILLLQMKIDELYNSIIPDIMKQHQLESELSVCDKCAHNFECSRPYKNNPWSKVEHEKCFEEIRYLSIK